MNKVTRDFIKEKDITVIHIRDRLNAIVKGINSNNKKNLTDINIICEEIFGRLLDELFDLKLTSTSVEISGNYIAVDLIDFEKKVAFQVTSQNDRDKIIDTVKKFNKSALPSQIDSLNILILGDKKKYHKPHILSLINGRNFTFKDNVLGMEKLLEGWQGVPRSGHI